MSEVLVLVERSGSAVRKASLELLTLARRLGTPAAVLFGGADADVVAELGRYGITANAVAPAARTGMTTAVEEMATRMAAPSDGSFDYWAPDNVSPLLVWLGSEQSSHITGRVFEAEGGKISIADGWRSTEGIDKCDKWAPSEIAGAVEKLLATEVPAQKVYGT